MKKIVLHIAASFPSSSNRLNLQCQYITGRWAIQLIHLTAERKSVKEFVADRSGVDIRTLPHLPRRSSSDSYLIRKIKTAIRRVVNSLALMKMLISSDASVLHAHENSSLWALLFWVVILTRPAVWDPHDYYHERLRLRKGLRGRVNSLEIMERLAVFFGVPILVVSQGMKQKFLEMYPAATIHIINNYSSNRGINIASGSSINEASRELVSLRNKLGNGKTRIVYPGLIKPERLEHDFVIKTGTIKNVLVDIYGEDRSGWYQQTIEDMLVNNNIDNVSMKGSYSSANIIQVLSQYHFAVFPFPVTYSNLMFCLPNKFYQCIEAGLPMIMTDMQEMGRIVELFGLGYVFPSRDYETYVSILKNSDTFSNEYELLVRNILHYKEQKIDYAGQKSKILRVYEEAAELNG